VRRFFTDYNIVHGTAKFTYQIYTYEMVDACG